MLMRTTSNKTQKMIDELVRRTVTSNGYFERFFGFEFEFGYSTYLDL
jgi:hypothetical protein